MPENPSSEPTERSNSPPIISSDTAIASSPRGAARFRIAAVVVQLTKLLSFATTAKNAQTTTVATMAPNSGRISSRVTVLTVPDSFVRSVDWSRLRSHTGTSLPLGSNLIEDWGPPIRAPAMQSIGDQRRPASDAAITAAAVSCVTSCGTGEDHSFDAAERQRARLRGTASTARWAGSPGGTAPGRWRTACCRRRSPGVRPDRGRTSRSSSCRADRLPSRAASAGAAPVGPSVRMPSMPELACNAPAIVSCEPVGSARSTGITSTLPPRPSAKPLQRSSSAVLPTSWFTQIAVVTPSAAILWPAMRPAANSVWPTWTSTPRFAKSSEPEFIEITGMPAATAASIDGPSASASGIVTTMPSGCEATAASMIWLISTMSNVPGAWYSTVTPMSSAAASTPLAATDQNGSDDWPWDTTTKR